MQVRMAKATIDFDLITCEHGNKVRSVAALGERTMVEETARAFEIACSGCSGKLAHVRVFTN